MVHPLYWPGGYFFYPIGNTSAVCLTRDLPPEEPADILLLGCGDPRNILYTIFCEPSNMNRPLDFTCCDIDPGVLARNVLLLTMVADHQCKPSDLWNIFYHIYVDQKTYALLTSHCKKLVKMSEKKDLWNASPYGRFLKVCTEYTLTELRRHWSLYISMEDLPPQRLKEIRDAFTTVFRQSQDIISLNLSTARSSGPLFGGAIQVTSEQCSQYQETGVTFTDPHLKASATLLNPTFVYSLAGEGCSVHYATDPLTSFHLAPLFGNAKRPVSVSQAVNTAMNEFHDWCSSFRTAVSTNSARPPIVRLFLGEATAACKTLHSFYTAGTLSLDVPVAPWNAQLILLDEAEYKSRGAPSTFNVVDTSNLDDHLGVLNVLVASAPLLSTSTLSSVLYTESLLSSGQDATKEFAERLYANLTIIGLLLGLCPVDYLSGFTSRSNIHELLLNKVTHREALQYHQATTWKSPISADTMRHKLFATSNVPFAAFEPRQLGTLLYDMYHQLFEKEDVNMHSQLNKEDFRKEYARSNLGHDTRESFVLFIKLIKHNLNASEENWCQVMDRLFFLMEEDKSMPMNAANCQDLCAQLYRHGVYTVPAYYLEELPKIGRFSAWNVVPPLVRLILVVPRERLAVLASPIKTDSTPPLHCDVKGDNSHNIFASVHAAYGRVVALGTKANPKVVFEEDPKRENGFSPLILSFVMPTRLLTLREPMERLNVCFSLRSTLGTAMFIPRLGLALDVFTARLTDESAVHILPEYPLPTRTPTKSPTHRGPLPKTHIGVLGPVTVDLDEQCELAMSLIGRLSVDNKTVQSLFQAGATPTTTQSSPTVMLVTIGPHSQHIPFPFPVIGSQNRLRLARKSLYIEIVVPIFGPFKLDGMKLHPYPVLNAGGFINPWNIHRVNISCLPVLNQNAKKVGTWLNPHIGSLFSTRERSGMKKHEIDTLVFVKQSIQTIMARSSGAQGSGPPRRLFALRDRGTTECDTLFFINGMRYDLQCHTMICDAYVLPLTELLMSKIRRPFGALVAQGNIFNMAIYEGEMQAWKMLLPAFVERCRTSWVHRDQCEYKIKGQIPLSDVMHDDPLCSCGRGKDVEGMRENKLWSEMAPFVTRFALSPLFAVSYLETVGRDPSRYMCFVCRGKGKPKLMKCTACQKTRYCSKACQKKDWQAHKIRCKPQN